MPNIKQYINSLIGLAIVIFLFFGVFKITTSKLGSNGVSTTVPTQDVYAVSAASSTAFPWSASEISGSFFSAMTTVSSTVSSTVVKILRNNPGAVFRSICNNGTVIGWITFNNNATSTSGAGVNRFVSSTGQIVAPNTCQNYGL